MGFGFKFKMKSVNVGSQKKLKYAIIISISDYLPQIYQVTLNNKIYFVFSSAHLSAAMKIPRALYIIEREMFGKGSYCFLLKAFLFTTQFPPVCFLTLTSHL